MDPRHAERGQHVAHVVAQRRREHDDQRRGRVDGRVVVREVRDPVQGHGGLAGAGGAADQQESPRRAAHELELRRVDERDDVGEVGVGAAAPAGAEAAIDAGADVVGAKRGALAAAEPRRVGLDGVPAVRGGLERPLGRLDAPEGRVADCDGPPRRQHAGAHPARDLLLERLALPVGVEEARDRRVPPVDDGRVAQEPRRLAEQHVLLAAVLHESHVGEVRRAEVHLCGAAGSAQLVEQRRLPVPLLEERRLVVRPGRLGDRGP